LKHDERPTLSSDQMQIHDLSVLIGQGDVWKAVPELWSDLGEVDCRPGDLCHDDAS
jgi:hypothetical protein